MTIVLRKYILVTIASKMTKFKNMPLFFDFDFRKEILFELENSKKIFKKNNWPVIDVTRKSVEETAASIIKIMDIVNAK